MKSSLSFVSIQIVPGSSVSHSPRHSKAELCRAARSPRGSYRRSLNSCPAEASPTSPPRLPAPSTPPPPPRREAPTSRAVPAEPLCLGDRTRHLPARPRSGNLRSFCESWKIPDLCRSQELALIRSDRLMRPVALVLTPAHTHPLLHRQGHVTHLSRSLAAPCPSICTRSIGPENPGGGCRRTPAPRPG